MTKGREATAYHVAGHAVIGLVGNLPVDGASIRPPNLRGSMMGEGILLDLGAGVAHPGDREAIDAHIRCLLAGSLAEERYTGRYQGISAEDMMRVNFIAESLGLDGQEARRYLAAKAYQAEDEVAQHWGEIERVAEALRRETTLDAEGLRSLVYLARPEKAGSESG